MPRTCTRSGYGLPDGLETGRVAVEWAQQRRVARARVNISVPIDGPP